MGLITKNGQISVIPSKKGKQKGFITKNGQISTVIPYQPTDVSVAVSTATIANVSGVALANISSVTNVAIANISNVIGVDKE
mgnify:CR=1 FL=1|tara:strand:+ start:576 stop:821 length:246 start_codon:yes stop_codon:yes gene_type:complete